ncbi:unnamed protein product [Blepharisma stoltei]|uniref:Uncharacterized protein n=1 Tax=Blepharisma stoltei TaxID=1481888 RepID=A0AAU9IPM4_9CILI|nr:unnamed protein product [Blepharisma stoltei]
MDGYDTKGQALQSIRKIAKNHRPDIFAFKRDPKDNYRWQQIFLAGIVGPSETPYEGGIFYISVPLYKSFYITVPYKNFAPKYKRGRNYSDRNAQFNQNRYRRWTYMNNRAFEKTKLGISH